MVLKKIIKYLFVVLCFVPTILFGQTYKAYVRAGDKAMEEKDYFAALTYFDAALKVKDTELGTWYKKGEAARQIYAYEIAEESYEKIKRKGQSQHFQLLELRLAQVKQGLGKYKDASKSLTSFIKRNKQHPETTLAGRLLQSCKWALQQTQESTVLVTHLDKNINSKYSEFAPYKLNGKLYYSALKYTKADTGQKYAKILIAEKENRGIPIQKGLNQEGKHTANLTFNKDGKKAYFSICENINAYDIRCAIYTSSWDNDKWSSPQKLPPPINIEGYTTTHPDWVEIDGIQYLFFVSDRPDGKGKMDIWKANVTQKKEDIHVENVGELNSIGNEIAPYYDVQSGVIYFSSDWYQGFGGFDLFQFKNQKIENLGLGYNSSYNDVYLHKEDDENYFFSSNRPDSRKLDKILGACCYDIYSLKETKLKVKEEKADTSLVVDSNKTNKDSIDVTYVTTEEVRNDIDKKIEKEKNTTKQVPIVSNKSIIKEDEHSTSINFPNPVIKTTKSPRFYENSMENLVATVYFDNDYPNPKTVSDYTDDSYEKLFQEYYKKRKIFENKLTQNRKDRNSHQIREDVAFFFENDVKNGFEKLEELWKIVTLSLDDEYTIEIILKGFTSPRAAINYNYHLSKRRIQSIENYFFKKRSVINHFKKGKIKIIYKPYGESTAPKTVSDKIDDRLNSVYSIEASKERRVEVSFKVIK